METFYWLAIGALALAAVGVLLWDNAHAMHPGVEPEPFSPAPSPDRMRFEHMDGVL
ncbi:hypothetical protein ACQR2B_06775 [Bradyrhizobium oligotrophicum]|uniref:hypothetical protein n=1 Tax=Bradyrhizobium TaxID=374 RepID=UPI003EBDC7F6